MHVCSGIYKVLPFLLLSLTGLVRADEKQDTTRHYQIGEITITEHSRSAELRSSAPLQLLNSRELQQLNALQVSDAVKYFSGVTVKDYGGIGGLKTVSVRSLGASHTAVSYDGIVVTDNQTGQMDIGRFSLDNVATLSLHNGQSDQIFQPARQFGSAAVLSIRSRSPFEGSSDQLQGTLTMKSGSFGLYNPSLFLRKKFNPVLAATLSTEWLGSHGRYPYRLYYHPSGQGEYSTEVRSNTDVNNLRIETALHAHFSEKKTGWIKLYYYNAERGLPGATILYATENFSTQRLRDRTFFARANFNHTINSIWSWQWNGNFHRSYVQYTDTAYLNQQGRQESKYYQQEAYSSLSVLYRALPGLSLSFSSDGIIGTMDAEFENDDLTSAFAQPARYTWLNVVAAKYVSTNFMTTASILSSYIHETVHAGSAAPSRHRLSPYLSITWKPFDQHDLRLRAFYKNIFRMPTFNDLYYARVGNSLLQPEITDQFNAGISWTTAPSSWWPFVSVTADLYHNSVQDKIIALPTKNIFEWSMQNLGHVSINGLDLTTETSFAVNEKLGIVLGGTYSYQQALDVTDPKNGSYQHQIPYTPRTSGSGRVGLETPWVDVSYTLLWSGKRYATTENYAENRLPAYSDHGLSAAREFRIAPSCRLNIRAELTNIMNENYAIVRWYPMPGRAYRISAAFHF
ncbi:MAG: TonB-dependent receptor plug domain-containing protein [Paludibacter sp.]|nr:TonB-dependent receptor plug domain-containing protein [Paludibacter sp.]